MCSAMWGSRRDAEDPPPLDCERIRFPRKLSRTGCGAGPGCVGDDLLHNLWRMPRRANAIVSASPGESACRADGVDPASFRPRSWTTA
jgi:hypothetical protein